MHETFTSLSVSGGVGVSCALPDGQVMKVLAGVLSVLHVELWTLGRRIKHYFFVITRSLHVFGATEEYIREREADLVLILIYDHPIAVRSIFHPLIPSKARKNTTIHPIQITLSFSPPKRKKPSPKLTPI